LRRRDFVLPRHTGTARFLHPVESLTGEDVEWAPAPREGEIISYSWVHLPTHGYAEDVPYVLATIGLDNGPQLMCNIVNAGPTDVRIGARVHLVFEERSDGWVVAQFTPIAPQPKDAP
jgi:uncharacterized OB-fold protein